MQKQIKTLGELKKSGWKSKTVKEEIRQNLIRKMKQDEDLFPGIIGYEKTVVPQLQHALLARHDLILLGLRGQAKTRILRMLVHFLDEYIPVVEGSEINDNPLQPISRYARDLIEEKGDQTPVSWLHRDFRYGEKLATPDTTVADLIGDIDPIKAAAQKLNLADENVINYGLVPRTNRGIFVINELPDLQPRIQVALLNIMQERDIQIRGFNIRIPLDLFMAFSANPEDYTNRGNIITPLKDRIDTQIITHYPKDIAAGMAITRQEADFDRNGNLEVKIHPVYREIIEQVAFDARQSEYVDQKSGVSTRMTITAMEQVYSSAERRALMNHESSAIVRISDLFHMVPALTGKMELVYEGEQEGAINVAKHIIGKAVNGVYRRTFPDPQKKKSEENPYIKIINWFKDGNEIVLPDTMGEKEYRSALEQVDGLKEIVKKYGDNPGEYIYVLMDLVLEALHQNSMLGKDDLDQERNFSDILGSMLGGMGDYGEEEDDDDFDEFRGLN
jgi:magnesium chelatase subunit I